MSNYTKQIQRHSNQKQLQDELSTPHYHKRHFSAENVGVSSEKSITVKLYIKWSIYEKSTKRCPARENTAFLLARDSGILVTDVSLS